MLKGIGGFSLLELKVSCVIISILSAVAIPNIKDIVVMKNIKHEARLLYYNMNRAKVKALELDTHVVFQHDENGYIFYVDDGALNGTRGDWQRQEGESIITVHKFSDDIRISESTFTRNRTRFNGRVGIKAGRVVLADQSGNSIQIILNVIGRARIEE